MSGPVTDRLLLSTPSTVKLLLRGRCPPTDGPEPTPTPPVLATPASSSDRFSTPLPVDGQLRTGQIGSLLGDKGRGNRRRAWYRSPPPAR